MDHTYILNILSWYFTFVQLYVWLRLPSPRRIVKKLQQSLQKHPETTRLITHSNHDDLILDNPIVHVWILDNLIFHDMLKISKFVLRFTDLYWIVFYQTDQIYCAEVKRKRVINFPTILKVKSQNASTFDDFSCVFRCLSPFQHLLDWILKMREL